MSRGGGARGAVALSGRVGARGAGKGKGVGGAGGGGGRMSPPPGIVASPPGRAAGAAVVLCGLPGAGKSVLARGLEAAAEAAGVTCTRVSFDEVCDTVLNGGESPEGFDPVAWRRDRAAALSLVDAALRQPEGERGERVVIVDDNMFYRSMRRVIFRMCRENRCAFVTIHVRVSAEVAAGRNRAREGCERVPEAAFQRMLAAFQPPAGGDCGWERGALDVDSGSATCADAVWARVRMAWSSAPPPAVTEEARVVLREAGQKGNVSSLVHAYDLWSRAVVRACVLSTPSPAQGAAVEGLRALRATLLRQVRQCAAQAGEDPAAFTAEFRSECESLCPAADLPSFGPGKNYE